MVKLSERAIHEIVSEKQSTRQCLYFTGHSSHIAVAEDDIISPWTLEAWIYRPPIVQAAKSYTRNMLMYLAEYNLAYSAEHVVKSKVLGIVRSLKGNGINSKNDRVDMLNELTALVPVYNSTVLSYMRALQNVAICVDASLSSIHEIMSEIGYRDSETDENLSPSYPGKKTLVRNPSFFECLIS